MVKPNIQKPHAVKCPECGQPLLCSGRQVPHEHTFEDFAALIAGRHIHGFEVYSHQPIIKIGQMEVLIKKEDFDKCYRLIQAAFFNWKPGDAL